jgi:hypothetical protein
VAKFTDEDDALLEELGVDAEVKQTSGRTAREERIIAGFEEIQRFVDQRGHMPQHGESKDIFERLYAVRLERIRTKEECTSLLTPVDHQGLLAGAEPEPAVPAEEMDDDELLAELGVDAAPAGINDLRHVRSAAEKRAAEEIANRKTCEDFERFKPLFTRAESDLKSGLRQSQPISAGSRSVERGDFFILDGLMLYVAEVGAPLKTTANEVDSRLRLIFSNGTESDLLLRSLQRAFYNDPAARRLVSPESGQISFGDSWDADDVESGTIYVLRSLSTNPYVTEHRDVLHKIGVTGGKVEARIANAENDSTYLLAKVEVVTTYKLAGINRTKLENLLHRFFSPARLGIEIKDRFGKPVEPREWYLVPLFVIDEVVARIKDGSITKYKYDPGTASLKLVT